MPEHYLGLMSDTSVDGIDAALVACPKDVLYSSQHRHFPGDAHYFAGRYLQK